MSQRPRRQMLEKVTEGVVGKSGKSNPKASPNKEVAKSENNSKLKKSTAQAAAMRRYLSTEKGKAAHKAAMQRYLEKKKAAAGNGKQETNSTKKQNFKSDKRATKSDSRYFCEVTLDKRPIDNGMYRWRARVIDRTLPIPQTEMCSESDSDSDSNFTKLPNEVSHLTGYLFDRRKLTGSIASYADSYIDEQAGELAMALLGTGGPQLSETAKSRHKSFLFVEGGEYDHFRNDSAGSSGSPELKTMLLQFTLCYFRAIGTSNCKELQNIFKQGTKTSWEVVGRAWVVLVGGLARPAEQESEPFRRLGFKQIGSSSPTEDFWYLDCGDSESMKCVISPLC